jgi:anion-transporting  ArsA/GET3 family ATPase
MKTGGQNMTEETKMILDRLDKLDNKIKDIQLTLENETNKNIQIIAEGHLDLSRKLDEALKVDNEKEMLLIRVNRLENELRRLKVRVEEIA